MYTCSYYTNLWDPDPLVSLFIDYGGASLFFDLVVLGLAMVPGLVAAWGHSTPLQILRFGWWQKVEKSCRTPRQRTSQDFSFMTYRYVQLKRNFMHLLSSSPNNALFLSTSFFVGSRISRMSSLFCCSIERIACRFQFYAFTAILELWIKGVLPEWFLRGFFLMLSRLQN